jgi:O-antigen ligase
MTLRDRLLFGSALALVPLLASAATMRPTLALMAAVAAPAALLATRSVAYPIALGGVPTLVIALLGRNPFPHGLITMLFFGWTALAMIWALLGGEARLPIRLLGTGSILFSFLLGLDLLGQLQSSQAVSYGSTKLQLFVLQNLVLLLAGVLIAQRREHLQKFLTITFLIAGASATLLLWRLAQGQAQALFDSRFTISADENPIQLGRESAEGLIIVTYILLAGARVSLRAAATVLIPVLVISLLAAGSRGPVLGALVGMLTLFAMVVGNRMARRRLLLVAVGGVFAAILAAQLVPGQSIGRSFSFLSGSGSGLTSNGRFELWSEAWRLFADNPLFGIGTGSFFAVDGLNRYPHNLLLEVGAELGIIGIALLLGFLASSWLALMRARRQLDSAGRFEAAVVAALFVAAIVNAMFSGDIQTNGEIWLVAGLAVGLGLRGERPEERSSTDEDPPSPVLAGHAQLEA